MAGALGIVTSTLVPTVSAAATPGPRSPPTSPRFTTVSNVSSTIPANGDLDPYGVADVPRTTGALVKGDTLVSNFNAKSNLQGTGTTIVQISPTGQRSVFAQISGPLPGKCPGGVGLTTALTVLNGGFVVVGSLPVTDAGMGTPEAGCLIVLNSVGSPVETWSGPTINGPWDLTSVQLAGFAELFVTNVLNAHGGGRRFGRHQGHRGEDRRRRSARDRTLRWSDLVSSEPDSPRSSTPPLW